jgi:hypothetical protein
VRIKKFVEFEASSPEHRTKLSESKIFECNVGETLVNDKRDYAYSFEIPPTVPSTANPDFRVIKINYVLSIKAKVLIMFIDLHM